MLYAQNVPITETYQVKNYDPKKKNVSISYSQIAAGDKAVQLVTESMESFIKRMDPNNKEKVVINGIVSEVKADFSICLEDGWPDQLIWNSKINNFKDGKLKNKTYLKMTKLPAKQPEVTK